MNAISNVLTDGFRAFDERRYSDAVDLLMPIAEAGNAEAQYKISEIYSYGDCEVETDDEKAWEWTKRAAVQDHIFAGANFYYLRADAHKENAMHILRTDDIEIPKSPEEIFSELNTLAEEGSEPAYRWLSLNYLDGLFTEQDLEKCREYTKKSADLGDANSLALLGLLDAVEKTRAGEEADPLPIFEEAVAGGSVIAKVFASQFLSEGIHIKKDLAKAYKYTEDAANEGDAEASLKAGKCKANGIGTEKSDQKAYDWYLLSANRSNREAQYILSQIDRRLPSIEISREEKLDWLHESARRGYLPAMSSLGWIMVGNDENTDTAERGCRLLHRAANLGNGDAQYKVGYLYRHGIVVEKDEKVAAKWWKSSAENDDPDGQIEYGFALFYGIGADKDIQLAERFFQRAFLQGASDAAIGLGYICHFVKYDHIRALGLLEYAAEKSEAEATSSLARVISDIRGFLSVDEIREGRFLVRQLEGRFAN